MTSTGASGDRTVPMRVIVCGVQRTGTLSTRTALHALGFHRCYHMHDLLAHPSRDAPQWTTAIQAKYGPPNSKRPAPFTLQDWDRLLGDCQAVADIPAALFGPELAAAYPYAKIIIQQRDPQSWYASVLGSIYEASARMPWYRKLQGLGMMALSGEFRAFVRFRAAVDGLVEGFDYAAEKEKALEWYDGVYEEFRTRIPRERCLEWNVKDGYAPLCEFLGVPLPQVEDGRTGELVDAEFPWENDRASFLETFYEKGAWTGEEMRRNVFAAVGQGTVLAAAGYGVYVLYRMRFGWRL